MNKPEIDYDEERTYYYRDGRVSWRGQWKDGKRLGGVKL